MFEVKKLTHVTYKQKSERNVDFMKSWGIFSTMDMAE
jgi:hypothetical protein